MNNAPFRLSPLVAVVVMLAIANSSPERLCLGQTQRPVGERTAADLYNAQRSAGEQKKQKPGYHGAATRDEIIKIEVPWDHRVEPEDEGQDDQSPSSSPTSEGRDLDELMWRINDQYNEFIARENSQNLTPDPWVEQQAFSSADGIGGKLAGDLVFHNECISFAYSPDSRLLFCGLTNGEIQVADTATWKVRARFRVGNEPIDALGVTADGKRLVAGCMSSKQVFVRDIATGRLVAEHQLPKPFGIRQIKLSPDARLLAVTGIAGFSSQYYYSSADGDVYTDVERQDPKFYVYDTATGSLLLDRNGTLAHAFNPWSPKGQLLLRDGSVWDVAAKKVLRKLPLRIPIANTGFTVASDGKIAIAVDSITSADHRQLYVRLHSGKTGQRTGTARVAELKPYQGMIGTLAVAPDSSLLAVDVEATPWGLHDSTNQRAIRLISLENGKQYSLPRATVLVDYSDSDSDFDDSGTVLSRHPSGNTVLQFSPDERLLTAIVNDKRNKSIVRTWQISPQTTPKKVAPPRKPEPELSRNEATSAIYKMLCDFVEESKQLDRESRGKSESQLKAAMKPLYAKLINDVTRIFRGKSRDEMDEIHWSAMDMYELRNERGPKRFGSLTSKITEYAPQRDFSKWAVARHIDKIMNDRR